MLSFLVVLAGLGWSLFLIQRYRDMGKLPDLFAPVTDEERKAREDAAILKSKLDDALIRLKHAEQDKARAERDAAHVRAEMWGKEKKLRDIGRILEREAVPVMAGDEARAG